MTLGEVRLSQRVRIALVGGLGAIAAFFVFGGAAGLTGPSQVEPESAAPRDAFLVASANLAELRRAPLHDVLFGAKAETSLVDRNDLGIAGLAEACGFDPLSRVERVVLAVPEDGEKGELGVAARVDVTRDELTRCTTALAERRGAKAEAKDVSGFAVVEAGTSGARIGYGHGLLVAGRGSWFDTMLATADGKKPSAREAALHTAIRRSLTGRDGWGSPTVLVSALLPRALRDRIRREMGSEAGSSPAAENAMNGVLGVSGVGLALRAGATGGSTEAAFELVCDGDEACAGVEKLVLKKRLDWSKELGIRMLGFGPLLDSIKVERAGARLRVTAGAPADALATSIDRVLRLRARRHERDGTDDPPRAPPRTPNETIPAPRP